MLEVVRKLKGFVDSKKQPAGLDLARMFYHSQLLPALLCVPQVVLRLLIDPALRRSIEGDRQANGHLGAYAGASIQDRG